MYSIDELQRHLEEHWQQCAERKRLEKGPVWKLHPDFRVLEFAPGERHNMWIYSTLGMSLEREEGLIELHIFSSKQDEGLVELLTAAASFHRNVATLGLYHTVNFGQPWQDYSSCDYGFISLPHLDGEDLEYFEFSDKHLHNFWLIPITARERNYKTEHGWEALEEAFEAAELDYLNADRSSCC